MLATRRGDLFVSHFGGGVTHVRPDGTQRDILGDGDVRVATNGFAMTAEGDFLCANLLPPGGVWRITPGGTQTPVVLEHEGETIASVNFVHVDAGNRIWVTVSTREEPRSLGYRPGIASGYTLLIDDRGTRLVADDIGYTNEAKVSPDGQWLVVNETFSRRTTRFPIATDGSLGKRQTLTEYGQWVWPDGLDFDTDGHVWISSVISNRLIRVAPDGTQTVIMEEVDHESIDEIETAYQEGRLGREHMDAIATPTLKSVSSITFGGSDLRTAYLGNLLDDAIYAVDLPFTGVKPPHWAVNFPVLPAC